MTNGFVKEDLQDSRGQYFTAGQFDNSSDEPELDETRKFMGIPNTPVHQFTGSDIDELDEEDLIDDPNSKYFLSDFSVVQWDGSIRSAHMVAAFLECYVRSAKVSMYIVSSRKLIIDAENGKDLDLHVVLERGDCLIRHFDCIHFASGSLWA